MFSFFYNDVYSQILQNYVIVKIEDAPWAEFASRWAYKLHAFPVNAHAEANLGIVINK